MISFGEGLSRTETNTMSELETTSVDSPYFIKNDDAANKLKISKFRSQ